MELYQFLFSLLKIIFVIAVCLGVVPVMVWFERRGCAWMQGRVGPNRVGPFGLLQPLADVVKFFFKEDWIPENAHRVYYYLAPMLALVAPVVALTAIPLASHIEVGEFVINMQPISMNSGILFVLALMGLEVYPIILAGWSSNNKYAILGALRGTSQIVSYEISMGVALLSMILLYGTFDLQEIVSLQKNVWGCFTNPIAALIFWISIFAETNRLPFDLPEGEAELVAGYHLEYGAMKFAAFFMAEYVAMIMASALMTTLFFGGYNLLPGMSFLHGTLSSVMGLNQQGVQNLLALFQFLSLFSKVAFFMFVYVWVRWTLPRFRFDQLMNLGWKILFPMALVNFVLMAFVANFIKPF